MDIAKPNIQCSEMAIRKRQRIVKKAYRMQLADF